MHSYRSYAQLEQRWGREEHRTLQSAQAIRGGIPAVSHKKKGSINSGPVLFKENIKNNKINELSCKLREE